MYRILGTIVGAVIAGGILVASPFAATADEDGIHKIKHVVIIMQENRSFDHYFGTYPGAEGLPTKDGKFTVCIPDPAKGSCAEPFHDTNDRNFGGSHGAGQDGRLRQAGGGRKEQGLQGSR